MCRIIRILLIVVGILLVAAALFFLFYLLPKIVEEKVENVSSKFIYFFVVEIFRPILVLRVLDSQT